jgi:hypothetical protein
MVILLLGPSPSLMGPQEGTVDHRHIYTSGTWNAALATCARSVTLSVNNPVT